MKCGRALLRAPAARGTAGVGLRRRLARRRGRNAWRCYAAFCAKRTRSQPFWTRVS